MLFTQQSKRCRLSVQRVAPINSAKPVIDERRYSKSPSADVEVERLPSE
jgi:hypothetical protein